MQMMFCCVPTGWFYLKDIKTFIVFAMFAHIRDAEIWIKNQYGDYGIIEISILLPNPSVPYSYQIITKKYDKK